MLPPRCPSCRGTLDVLFGFGQNVDLRLVEGTPEADGVCLGVSVRWCGTRARVVRRADGSPGKFPLLTGLTSDSARSDVLDIDRTFNRAYDVVDADPAHDDQTYCNAAASVFRDWAQRNRLRHVEAFPRMPLGQNKGGGGGGADRGLHVSSLPGAIERIAASAGDQRRFVVISIFGGSEGHALGLEYDGGGHWSLLFDPAMGELATPTFALAESALLFVRKTYPHYDWCEVHVLALA